MLCDCLWYTLGKVGFSIFLNYIRMDTNTAGAVCGCVCHKAKGILIVLFGLLFLAQAFGWASATFVMYAWPVLVVLYGVKKMCDKSCKCC